MNKNSNDYADKSLGKVFTIWFNGLDASLPQFELREGNTPIVGRDVVFGAEILRPYAQSLIWSVIPGEYLFTKHDNPAWTMTVNDNDGSSA